jgi:uncharacterized protein YkwD
MKDLAVYLIPLLFLSCRKEPIQIKETAADESAYNVKRKIMLDLLNQARGKGCVCGTTQMPPAPPLAWNDTLARIAYLHSVDMKSKDFLSHTGSDGSGIAERVNRQGFGWSALGENIATGDTSDSTVVAGWLKSDPHCRNIMNPSFRLVGAGMEQRVWTQVLASRK